MKIKKKEYYAHCNTKFNTAPHLGKTYILKLEFNEWMNLYVEDKQHWYHVEKYDSDFSTYKRNPIYSVAVKGTNDGFHIIYKDFCVIFSSFKDYKYYIDFLTRENIDNNILKEDLISTIVKNKNNSEAPDFLYAVGIRANTIVK